MTSGKFISLASRGCDRLYWLDLIITDKAKFNPYDAKCACKQIEVTESFFAALGMPLKLVYRERARLLNEDPNEVIRFSCRFSNWFWTRFKTHDSYPLEV
ncbi:hypothetical protein ACNCTC_005003, partial [Escherichia coli]